MDKFCKNIFYLICTVFVLKLITIFLHPLHHPSEARYASISMRMALTENYLMPFFDPVTPFFGKPPLSFWASAFFIELFGFNEFAGRLPHYLALVLTCLVLYRAVKESFDKKTAIISIAVLSTSILFYALHTIMTEAFLLLGMTLITTSFIPTLYPFRQNKPISDYEFLPKTRNQRSAYFGRMGIKAKEGYYDLLFFLGCVIAMLTKGPVGIVMPCLAMPVYLTYTREWKNFFKNFPLICGGIFFIAATLPWFLLAEKSYPGFLEYFFLGENLGRFVKTNWEGDRYGNAHYVHFGMIWAYFILATIPTLFALVMRPKQSLHIIINETKSDKTFLFFALSFLMPMLLLTFMRNMIPTYAIYSLIPFSVLAAKILEKIKWDKFVYFLPFSAIVLYTIIISSFAIKPATLIEKLNYQQYLLDKIPQKEYQLYYLGDSRTIFTLYWKTKDSVKIVTKENFFDNIDPYIPLPSYVIGNSYIYDQLLPEEKDALELVVCTKKRKICLYELFS